MNHISITLFVHLCLTKFLPHFLLQINLLQHVKDLLPSNFNPGDPHVDYTRVYALEHFEESLKKQFTDTPFSLILPLDRPYHIDIWGRWRPKQDKLSMPNVYFGKCPVVQVGQAIVVSADCLHRTSFPLLTEEETLKDATIPPCPRLQILIGAKHAVDSNGNAKVCVVWPRTWPRWTSKNKKKYGPWKKKNGKYVMSRKHPLHKQHYVLKAGMKRERLEESKREFQALIKELDKEILEEN